MVDSHGFSISTGDRRISEPSTVSFHDSMLQVQLTTLFYSNFRHFVDR